MKFAGFVYCYCPDCENWSVKHPDKVKDALETIVAKRYPKVTQSV